MNEGIVRRERSILWLRRLYADFSLPFSKFFRESSQIFETILSKCSQFCMLFWASNLTVESVIAEYLQPLGKSVVYQNI